MRIIAGEWRGRPLLVPGSGTRPTADRVRQILFDILGDRVVGTRVLDLYAGSGSLGLEALSRGAAAAVFVELSRPARVVLERNCAALGAAGRCRILGRPAVAALRSLEREGERFGLILADPPYGEEEAVRLLDHLGATQLRLLPGAGEVIVECGRRETVPQRFGRLERLRRRDIGDTSLHFFSVVPSPGRVTDSELAAAGGDSDRRTAATGGGFEDESGAS